jgi:hypothetical protein
VGDAARARTRTRPRDLRSTEQQLADLEREIEEERLRAEARPPPRRAVGGQRGGLSRRDQPDG